MPEHCMYCGSQTGCDCRTDPPRDPAEKLRWHAAFNRARHPMLKAADEIDGLRALLRECLLEGSGFGKSSDGYLPIALRQRVEAALNKYT